ncbi:phage tail assembly protein T [Escherichia coli]|uniref:phage tail assembly protein T n=1 Tax=Escherichia coli TaxID=562 RepID=UPI0039899FF3
MGRPDWRATLPGMTSQLEYARLATFLLHALFSRIPNWTLIFSGLMYAVLSLFFGDPDMHPADFSLLAPACEEEQTEMPDEEEMLMQKSDEGVARRASGSEGTEGAIFHLLRMWWMSARMMLHYIWLQRGFPGGVRYVPASG